MNNCISEDPLCISAYGAITPMGSSINEIYDNFINGSSGIREILKFNHTEFETHDAGLPVEGNENICWPRQKNFRNGELYYAKQAAKRLNSSLRLLDHYDSDRVGCIVGIDEPAIDIEQCIEFCQTLDNCDERKSLVDAALDHFKINDFLDLDTTAVLKVINEIIPFSGLSFGHLGLCSASTQSIGLAMRAVSRGELDAVICGGISAKVTPLNLARLEGMGVISTDQNFKGTERSRPFDRQRSGFVLSEGAGLFTVEKLSKVLERGDKPLAILLGYGGSLCAQHIVMPHIDDLEMKLSMERALADSGLSPDLIDVINTHGTSTQQNDIHESSAIKKVFSGHKLPLIVATKSFHGHLIAAAGAMEMLGILVSFQKDYLPRVKNCIEVDPQLPGDLPLVLNDLHAPVRVTLKNSFGMGGGAASLVIGNPAYM